MPLTPAQIYAFANNYHGRSSPALDEMLRVCEAELPGCIEYANETWNLNLPTIKTWDYAGCRMSDEPFPAVLVTTSVRADEFGSGFKDEHEAVIFVAHHRQERREVIAKGMDIADSVRAIFGSQYLGPHNDPWGRLVWHEMLPGALTRIPPEWEYYSGTAVHFTLRQYPGNSLWALGPD